MLTANNKKENMTSVFKMTDEKRLNITNQLKEAILFNKENPKTTDWDSSEYRRKYGL